MWTLHLAELKSGEDRFSHAVEEKWKRYLDNWWSLEDEEPSSLMPNVRVS